MPLQRALEQLRAREAELARVQRIGLIGGLEVMFEGGGIRNIRSPEYLRVHGLPASAADESHEDWVARIHPLDRERVTGHFQKTLAGDALDYEIEYRIIRPVDGKIRWIMAKAEIERDENGKPLRLAGAHIDITARREAEEQRELITRELAHRITNIFSVMSSIVSMSAREDPTSAKFAEKLTSRIGALHRAHGLMLSPGSVEDTVVKLISRVVEPYQAQDHDRVVISGEDAAIGRQASIGMALMLHELATNAVKYGALSVPTGNIAIDVQRDGEALKIRWQEFGGPQVSARPSRQGFGSILVDRAARAQLGAALDFEWLPDGLRLTATIPLARLGA